MARGLALIFSIALLGLNFASATEPQNFSRADISQAQKALKDEFRLTQTDCLPGLKKCFGNGPGNPYVCCKQSDTCAQSNGQPYCR
jgi:hypothetical protein